MYMLTPGYAQIENDYKLFQCKPPWGINHISFNSVHMVSSPYMVVCMDLWHLMSTLRGHCSFGFSGMSVV